MQKSVFQIVENSLIAPKTYRLILVGADIIEGEFVNISIPGYYLRRPLSVCDLEDGKLTIVYKVVGEGTKVLSGMAVGAEWEGV